MASRLFKYLPRAATIMTSIKHYPPTALRAMGATAQAFTSPNTSPSKFWDMAKKSQGIFQVYVPRLLGTAADYFKSTKFTDITSAMTHIVSATTTFRDNVHAMLDARKMTLDTFSQELERVFTAIMHNLEKMPLPEKPPGNAERADMVENILNDVTLQLQDLAQRYGIEEEVVTAYLLALKPWVHTLIVAVGDITEQHPELFPALGFSVATMLIPELRILRPFLRLFGFGPTGPVKGSAAAHLQSRFWGNPVERDSES